jgi:hypothetical protein
MADEEGWWEADQESELDDEPVVIVGGKCSVEGCKRTTMHRSQYCYKHKLSAPRPAPPKHRAGPTSMGSEDVGALILYKLSWILVSLFVFFFVLSNCTIQMYN